MEQNTAINQGIIAPELISTPAKGALLCVEPLDLYCLGISMAVYFLPPGYELLNGKRENCCRGLLDINGKSCFSSKKHC